MDLNYDYGDVVHTHGHIHTKPDSHKQVVEHALKEWCHTLFGEDAEEKCEELNEIEFHDIDDGSKNEIKVSDIFKAVSNLKKLSGHYIDLDENKYRVIFKGTQIFFYSLDNQNEEVGDPQDGEIEITKDDKGFKLTGVNLEITETNLKILNTPPEEDIILNKFNLNSKENQEYFDLDYDSRTVVELKQILRNLNLDKLRERIDILDKDVKAKNKEIVRRKDLQVDEVSALRKLNNLEKLEKDKIKELIYLIIFLIIGICFGIFCVYTGFVLDLD